jgi:D-sedoheptulose 7-phosphate isomerase|tara:strand:- start:1073 stop:1645 length:573 start_codon:yes stop_codon:yes gene_type:complete
MNKIIIQNINESIKTKEKLKKQAKKIEKISNLILNALDNDGKIFFFGNGGSAGDAQHIAAELVGKFQKKRKGLSAIALTTNTSILTAIGNDFGFDFIFERQVESLVKPNDIVVGISTSGNSENVIKGIKVAKKIGAITIGLTGSKKNKLEKISDFILKIPSTNTQRIQEAHIMIGHIICEIIENKISKSK